MATPLRLARPLPPSRVFSSPLLLGAVRLRSTLPSAGSSPVQLTNKYATPLAGLPTLWLFRSLLLHSITSTPFLLRMGTKIMKANMETIDQKALLKWGVDKTFYAQYCAGSTPTEIAKTVSNLHGLGFAGAILTYAREVEQSDTPTNDNRSAQIQQWLEGTLKTIYVTAPGDYIAVKYTGAGLSALSLLYEKKKCFENEELGAALISVCEAAKERYVRLLIDAEQQAVQDGIDDWTMELMRRYNTGEKALIYNTYQMYLKSCSQTLRKHLDVACKENFTLGVKLVRGAYLATDPRHLIHDTKEDTDNAFDEAVKFLLTRDQAPGEYQGKKVDLILASHNKASVEKGVTLRQSLGSRSAVGEMVYAQLMGMADELSLSLLSATPSDAESSSEKPEPTKVYKYVVWGTTKECVKYMMRRAEENKDAVGRTRENRQAVLKEVLRRARASVGLA